MKSEGKILNRKKIENRLIKYFSDQEKVLAVYVFGSFNNKRFNEKSDLDLALIYSKDADKFKKFNLKLKFMTELEEFMRRNVDIVDFSRVDLKFKHQILNGKLIYCIDQKERVKLESEAISNYIDMKRFYDIYEKNLGKKF